MSLPGLMLWRRRVINLGTSLAPPKSMSCPEPAIARRMGRIGYKPVVLSTARCRLQNKQEFRPTLIGRNRPDRPDIGWKPMLLLTPRASSRWVHGIRGGTALRFRSTFEGFLAISKRITFCKVPRFRNLR
jgi:hypothetical protein